MMRIGTAGWSIPKAVAAAFVGEGSHLELYGRVLTCAEINSSFYRPPMASTWVKWAAAVPEDFRFAVKAPKTITHEGKLVVAGEALNGFLAGTSLLGDKLGPILFQLPPKLVFEAGTAGDFFELLRGQYAGLVALEPRHASWFTEEVSELLVRFEVARVAADPAKVPEAGKPGGWRGLTYYRLHGSPRVYYSAYTGEYLDELAQAVVGLPEAWVIFDNTASGAALGNALALMERLGR